MPYSRNWQVVALSLLCCSRCRFFCVHMYVCAVTVPFDLVVSTSRDVPLTRLPLFCMCLIFPARVVSELRFEGFVSGRRCARTICNVKNSTRTYVGYWNFDLNTVNVNVWTSSTCGCSKALHHTVALLVICVVFRPSVSSIKFNQSGRWFYLVRGHFALPCCYWSHLLQGF